MNHRDPLRTELISRRHRDSAKAFGHALKITRRRFTAMIGGMALSAPPVLAADPDFTLAVVPDPQYIPSHCGQAYRNVMNWCINNQSLSVGGSPLNIKCVIGVGDCVNTPSAGKEGSGEDAVAIAAYRILDSNNFPWITPPGNHDMLGGQDLSARQHSTAFQNGGFFAADTRAAKPYWGAALPGDGGSSAWGGSFDAANCFLKLRVGARRIVVLSLEFHPRTAVLTWAKGVHDAHPDSECIIATHSYSTDTGGLVQRASQGDIYATAYGPDAYLQGAAPLANSGHEMWNGSPGWAGLKGWDRLTVVLCGHWIYAPWHTGVSGPWYINRQAVNSASLRGQTVQQIFCNLQDLDNVSAWCPAGAADLVAETAHLMLLKFRPSLGTLEGYALSTNSGKWIGSSTLGNATPQMLFSVAYAGVPPETFRLPQRIR